MYAMRKEELEKRGVNLEDFVTVYPGTSTRYISWRLQQQLFYSVYPNGSITVTPPEPDPLKTAETWISTCRVYTDKSDMFEAASVTARRGPTSEDAISEGEYIDPYKLCQIAAISDALTGLGFSAPIMTNAENEKFLKDSLIVPPEETPSETMPAEAAPAETKEETKAKKPRKRTPKKKEEKSKKQTPAPADEKAEEAVPAPVATEPAPVETPAKEEPKEPEAAPVAEKEPETDKPVKTEAAEPEPVNQTEVTQSDQGGYFNSVEEARADICEYRNFAGMTIGEIFDNRKENKGYESYIQWALGSTTAERKYPRNVEAVKYLCNQ